MLSRCTPAVALLLAILAAPESGAEQRQAEQAPATPTAPATATAISIYADPLRPSREARGHALIQQRRRVELPNGEGRLTLADLPALLDPASVLLRAADGDDDAFTVAEQTFHAIADDPDAVLRRYIGHDVLINRRQSGPGEQARLTETISAKLLAFDDKVLVLQTSNRQLPIQIITRGPDISEIKLTQSASMPATRPTLSWLIFSEKPGPRDVDLLYQTRGFAWDAHYTLLLDADGPAAWLDAWASVVNRSGAEFTDAEVRLIAEPEGGQPHPAAAPYLLPRRVTLSDDATRRIALLEGSARASVSRINVFASRDGNDVAECLSLDNTRENHLGLPLPPGRVRIMRDAGEAPATLIGESRTPGAPPGGALLVRLGRADGLAATRRSSESARTIDGERRMARTIALTLASTRKENTRILIIEPLEGAQQIIQHSHPYDGNAAPSAITFDLDLPAGQTTTLTYSIALDGD